MDSISLMNKRWLTTTEGCFYTGLKRSTFERWTMQIGAKKRCNGLDKNFYDRLRIDEVLENSTVTDTNINEM